MTVQPSPEQDVSAGSFYGQFQRGLDKKGRVILPAPIREKLGAEAAFITKGIEKCLLLMPAREFNRRRERMQNLNLTSAKARKYKRRFFSNAAPVKPDGMGRINIPSYLREYAELTGDVIFAGVDTHIEIWDAERWRRHQEELDDEEIQEDWEDLNI